jgi:HK97 family phage major capsid protein
MDITKALKIWLVANCGVCDTADDQTFRDAAAKALQSGTLTPAKLAELIGDDQEAEELADKLAALLSGKGPTARDVFGGGNPRVKSPSERYCTKRADGRHVKTGQPVLTDQGRPACLPSELDHAKAGVLLKTLARRAGASVSLTDHETGLLAETFDKDTWAGQVNGEWVTGIPGGRAKALLDDATSGGLEVVPIWFDEAIVQFPLLYGELFPFVDRVEVPRGRRIEGASIDNPTLTWGTAEGTALSAFDTGSLVAALNTTVHPVAVYVEVGRDFLSDSPAEVGRILVQNIGQRLMNELDKVIADGDGTSQPEGIFVASGVTDVGNPAGGAGADPQIDDYETLMFGIDKQYRSAVYNPCFVANDTSYQRARAIAVGDSDARRVFGMDHNSYSLLGWPYRIENSAVGNAEQAFGALKKYRLYRRVGQEVRWTMEGDTLTRKNLALLSVRGRYGGRVMDTNAFCKTDSAKA